MQWRSCVGDGRRGLRAEAAGEVAASERAADAARQRSHRRSRNARPGEFLLQAGGDANALPDDALRGCVGG